MSTSSPGKPSASPHTLDRSLGPPETRHELRWRALDARKRQQVKLLLEQSIRLFGRCRALAALGNEQGAKDVFLQALDARKAAYLLASETDSLTKAGTQGLPPARAKAQKRRNAERLRKLARRYEDAAAFCGGLSPHDLAELTFFGRVSACSRGHSRRPGCNTPTRGSRRCAARSSTSRSDDDPGGEPSDSDGLAPFEGRVQAAQIGGAA